MKVKLLNDWRGYKKGRILEIGDGAAKILIARKKAKRYAERRPKTDAK